MASTQQTKFTNIANSIRAKTRRTNTLIANNFATEINSMALPVENYKWTHPRLMNSSGDNQSNYDGAMAAVVAAISYWNAKAGGTKSFSYSDGNGALKGSTSATVNNSSGAGVIDCSTYIGLVLRGYDFAKSPYGTNFTASGTVDPRTLTYNAGQNNFEERYFDNQSLANVSYTSYLDSNSKYRILSAADIAAYYESLGLLFFPGQITVRPGDLCFFYKENADGSLTYPNRWRGISHIGIMTDKDYYLNTTDYPSAGNLIRTKVSARTPFCYARPFYGVDNGKSASNSLSNNGINLFPNVWAGLKNGSQTINSLSITTNMNSNGAMSCSGQASSGFSKDLVSSSCPLYLPAGTYKISGTVNGTSGNKTTLHQYFGMRAYNAVTGNGIPGTTWSADGANSQSRTTVWDIGGGGQFTLSSATYVKFDFYFTSSIALTGVSCTPVLKKIS